MLVRELIEHVQETLQDNKPPFARWPERGLVRWINFGQMALAKYLPLVSTRTDTIKLVPGTAQDFRSVSGTSIIAGVDAQGIALMRLIRNMGAAGTTPGKAIRGPVDRYSKDSLEPDWHNEVGDAVREFVFDRDQPLKCWVSPGVPAAGLWVDVQWMAYPAAIPAGGAPGSEIYVSPNTVPLSVTDQYAEELHHYVVAMALLKGSKDMQNLPKSQHHANLFLQSLNMQAQAQTGVNPNLKALPFVQEDA